MSQEIYEVRIFGNEAAIQALTQLDNRAKQASEQFNSGAKAGATSAETWADKVRKLGDKFKDVSRDVDSVGGSFAATFARGTDDVLSMVTAIGSGGLLGGVAVLSTAVGLLYTKWQEEQARTKAAIERSTQQLVDQAAMHDDLAKRILASGKDITEEDKNNARASSEAYKKELAVAQQQYEIIRKLRGKNYEEMLLQTQLEAQMALRVGDIVMKQKMDEAQVLAYRKQRLEAQRQEFELSKIDVQNANALARAAERRALAENNIKANGYNYIAAEEARNERIRAARAESMGLDKFGDAKDEFDLQGDAENDPQNQYHRRILDAQAEADRSYRSTRRDAEISNESELAQGRVAAARNGLNEFSTMDQRARVMRYEAEQQASVERLQLADRERKRIEEMSHDEYMTLNQLDEDHTAIVIANRQAETEATIRALERQQQAEQRMMAQQVYGTGVNAAYGASMYYVGQSIDFVAGQAQKFGNINRDNWRDMLAITEDTKAAFAAQLQAFLFNMGIQSGKMAVFEMAEASKEGALMAGSIAVYDFAGAANHGISAAAHLATAGLYATLGTGAVGGSLAIGALRGSDGPIKAVPDNPVTGTSGAGRGGPSASGGPDGQAGNTWNSPSVININNDYGGGGINAQDDRRAAQAVARGVQRANQSYVMRRQMQRAT